MKNAFVRVICAWICKSFLLSRSFNPTMISDTNQRRTPLHLHTLIRWRVWFFSSCVLFIAVCFICRSSLCWNAGKSSASTAALFPQQCSGWGICLSCLSVCLSGGGHVHPLEHDRKKNNTFWIIKLSGKWTACCGHTISPIVFLWDLTIRLALEIVA